MKSVIIYNCLSLVCLSFNTIYTQEISSDITVKIKLPAKSIKSSIQSIDSHLELAKILIEQKQYNKAIIQLDSSLNYDRENAFVWHYKGIAHLNLTEYNTALKCFNRAIKLKDENFEFHLYRGIVYHEIGSFDQALKSIELAHSIADSAQQIDLQTKAIFWKGRIFHAQDDHTNAAKFFRQALELQPDFYEAKRLLTEIEINEWYLAAELAFHQENWELANANYKKILNIDPTFKDVSQKNNTVRTKLTAQMLIDSTDVANLRNDYKKAEKFLGDATSLDPERKSEIQILTEQINEHQNTSAGATDDSSAVIKTPKIRDTSIKHVRKLDSLKTKPEIQKVWQLLNLKWIFFISLILIITASLLLFWRLKKKETETKSNNSIPFLEANKSNLSLEFSRYSIKEELGRGSMGRIYKAYDLKLERYIALKLIHLETDMHKDEIEERINRFLLEAKATANLNHPNIVSLYDYDEIDGIFYMTMEFIEGESLYEMIKNLKRIEIEHALEIIKQICSALEYAHKQNIIHRDIKPSNIILNRDGRVKILDFGLAKIINLTKDESCTVTGMRVGSPSYMSPEQINSNALDVRSDIFSMGIVFYEMLTSENPFRIKKGESLSRLFYLILNEIPAKPSSIRKEIPSYIDRIIEKMLAKDPQQRYQTVSEVIQALDTFQKSK